MPKIRVKVTTISNGQENNYEINALLKKDKIIYNEPDPKKTKVIFDYANNLLIRKNKDLEMVYEFDLEKETIGSIEVKSLKRYLNLNIATQKYEVLENNLDLIFLVEEEEIGYKLEVIK